MKRQLRTVAAVAAAVAMTMASVMTASAHTGGAAAAPDPYAEILAQNLQSVRDRLREKYPAITDEHIEWIIEVSDTEISDDFEGYWDYQNSYGGWNNFSVIDKESWAYLCALDESDREWLRTHNAEVPSFFTRDTCIWGGKGADAAELDAIIARLTGQAIPTPPNAVPSWKQDSKGWWVERSDGSYLVNEWYQSPESGLWYYMGADGYMLTSTTTPDGYTVNADGVWVQ